MKYYKCRSEVYPQINKIKWYPTTSLEDNLHLRMVGHGYGLYIFLGSSLLMLQCSISHLRYLKCFKNDGYFATEILLYGRILGKLSSCPTAHIIWFLYSKKKFFLAFTTRKSMYRPCGFEKVQNLLQELVLHR